MRRAPVVVAAVDVGSTSVHLLIAAVAGHRLRPLVDESVLLGLGAAGTAGLLGPALRAQLVGTLVQYTEIARRAGATEIAFVGTEPLRRAADAAAAVADVERATGLRLHVLEHAEEGLLTLIGVTGGRPVSTELVVVDVGGGSSELVVVGPGRAASVTGLRIGAAGLTAQLVRSDPPDPAEVGALTSAARAAFADAPDVTPREIVAVGGTASNLLRVLPAAALDRMLTRDRLAEALSALMAEPSSEAVRRYAVNPVRARILPAGSTILDAVLERYGLDRLRVSEAGIREGLALVTARAGGGWRDRLAALAAGWAR